MINTIQPAWTAPRNVRSCCTTRLGGVSEVPYDSLNLGLHVGDEPARVARNRELVYARLQLPSEPSWIDQSHGTRVVTLEKDASRDADAAITREPGRVAVVMIADCLPILLCNRAGSEVAAVHAGWRGLQAGVVQATLAAMASPPAQLMAWIGPGISAQYFEVGDEVRDAFIGAITGAKTSFSAHGDGHWLCDLASLAQGVLQQQGVGEVSRDSHCSFRDRDLFYSYRREAVTGRMAALIWIDPRDLK